MQSLSPQEPGLREITITPRLREVFSNIWFPAVGNYSAQMRG
jgi:hypothetical protein